MNGVVQTPTCALRRCRTPAHDVPTMARANPCQRQRDRTAGSEQNASRTTRHWNTNRARRQADAHPNPGTIPPSPRVTQPDGAEQPARRAKPRAHVQHRSTGTTHPPATASGMDDRPRRESKPPFQPHDAIRNQGIGSIRRAIRPSHAQQASRTHGGRRRPAPTREGKTGAKKRAPPGVPGGAHEAGGDLLSRGAVSSATRA